MEGTHHGKAHIFTVRRGFEVSRLEEELLAAAYERVLPQVRVKLTEGRSPSRRADVVALCASVAPSVASHELSTVAMGGHLS